MMTTMDTVWMKPISWRDDLYIMSESSLKVSSVKNEIKVVQKKRTHKVQDIHVGITDSLDPYLTKDVDQYGLTVSPQLIFCV